MNEFQTDACSILEGRSVLREGITIGIVLGIDILNNKELEYQDGKWILRLTGVQNNESIL